MWQQENMELSKNNSKQEKQTIIFQKQTMSDSAYSPVQ